MEQQIIDDLILTLHELFPNIKAYDVKMEMDIEPPMFQIECYRTAIRDRILPGGFFYDCDFEIIFFPGNDEPEIQIREVQLELMNALWRFGDGYRADDRHAETVDGILHVFFSVTLNLRPALDEPPKIKELQTEINENGKKIFTSTTKTES